MALPAFRRRFVYPSADIVTLNPHVDAALDRLAAPFHPTRVRRLHGAAGSGSRVVVLGFPRSGNTFLAAWLAEVVRPGVTVVDGRSTHSALDLHRYARAGVPVIIPARPPLETCASMMLRAGKFDHRDYAREMLRAYSGWYQVAEHSMACESATVITFEQIIEKPSVATEAGPIADLVDQSIARKLDLGEVAAKLRRSLAGVPGQGSDQDGVEARLMHSLPEPTRAWESATATALLLEDSLAEVRQGAERAYAAFMASAWERGRLAGSQSLQGVRTK